MTRASALPHLPCYVAGDLPPGPLADIDKLLDEDVDLRTLVAQLRAEQDLVARELALTPLPDALTGEWAPTPAIPATPARRSLTPARVGALVAAIVAAVVLGVGGWWVSMHGATVAPTSTATAELAVTDLSSLVDAYSMANAEPHRLKWYDAQRPDDLSQAFDAAHVSAPLRQVPDLSAIKLKTIAVVLLPTDPAATAVIYETPDHVRYVCQMHVRLPNLRDPDLKETISGHEVRFWHVGDVTLAAWDAGPGMVCVFGAELPVDQVLAMVIQRIGLQG